MSVFSYVPQQGFTPQEIDAWLLAAKEKRAALHLQAAAPWHSKEHHEAFTQMSDLLQQAFEEVRVISASLREGSQCVRDHSTELREHSTQLMARCTSRWSARRSLSHHLRRSTKQSTPLSTFYKLLEIERRLLRRSWASWHSLVASL